MPAWLKEGTGRGSLFFDPSYIQGRPSSRKGWLPPLWNCALCQNKMAYSMTPDQDCKPANSGITRHTANKSLRLVTALQKHFVPIKLCSSLTAKYTHRQRARWKHQKFREILCSCNDGGNTNLSNSKRWQKVYSPLGQDINKTKRDGIFCSGNTAGSPLAYTRLQL